MCWRAGDNSIASQLAAVMSGAAAFQPAGSLSSGTSVTLLRLRGVDHLAQLDPGRGDPDQPDDPTDAADLARTQKQSQQSRA